MDAGARDTRITFERATGNRDGYGKEKPNWALYARAWSRVVFGSGQERRERAQESATITATFVVPWSAKLAALTPADRLLCDGVWDIHGIAPRGWREELEITAAKAAQQE